MSILFDSMALAILTLLLLSLVTSGRGHPQKPNLDAILNRRTDVYIAGFFPFGKGVENSNTGLFIDLLIFIYGA